MDKKQMYISNLNNIVNQLQELDDILFDYPMKVYLSITEIEICALLIRKILENIAFGVLIMNYEIYMQNNGKINEWNIKRILKTINKGSNEEIFLKLLPWEDGDIHRYRNSEIIDLERFFQTYNWVSGIIHEKNPFKKNGSEQENEYLKNKLIKIRDEIVSLLNRHEIAGVKIIMKNECKNYDNFWGYTWM